MTNAFNHNPVVVYWNNLPAPYMVERFNAVERNGVICFEAWFNDLVRKDRSWEVNPGKWLFQYKVMPSVRIGEKRFHLPIEMARTDAQAVVCLYEGPSFLIGWLIGKVRKIKVVFWVVQTSERWVRRSWMREWIKRLVFPRVDAWVTTGPDGRAYAEGYGADPARVYTLAHSIDVERYSRYAMISSDERQQLRERYGVSGIGYIYVGRINWEKGLKTLLDAFANIENDSGLEASLILVGDGRDEQEIRQYCSEAGIRNVVFVGYLQKNDVAGLYQAVDIFVFPTLGDPYGMVVDEAMASGLPVIASDSAGEIRSRVEPGVTGFVFPVEDNVKLAEYMAFLGKNMALREEMGQCARQRMNGRTPEKWARDFESIVQEVLSG